jgi:hypothetical protein
MDNFMSRRQVFGLLMGLATPAAVGLGATPVAAASPEATFARHSKGSSNVIDQAVWDRLLKAHVKPDGSGFNRVDYARWKANGHKELKSYVAALQAVDPGSLDRPEQFAFWVNLYNARTVDLVLDRYPVKSIKEVSLGGGLKALVGGGPWQANVVKVSGMDLSLDDIEHKILRALFKDARVHYALNCASYGCPNLQTAAYTGAGLEAMLEEGARAFVNHPRGIAVKGGKVTASQIYSWFEADFGGSASAVLAHVRRYAGPELTKSLEGVTGIAAYEYNWSLNDVGP